jgi:hypothetical protein
MDIRDICSNDGLLNKDFSQSNSEIIATVLDKFKTQYNVKHKKEIDERCVLNKDCISGHCAAPSECNLIFKDPYLCHQAKTCQTSNAITQPSNFTHKKN